DYATNKDRLAKREEVFALLQKEFSKHPWSYWKERLRKASVPSGEIRTVAEAIRSPEARERHLITRIPHPTLGWVPTMPLPIRYSDTPMADPKVSPGVGQHSAEVLQDWLGYGQEQIDELGAKQVVGIRSKELEST